MHPIFDAGACSESLSRDDVAGIWRARHSAAVSYPEDHATCFQIEDTSFWFRHRNRCITAAVQQWAPPGFILDVGGGNGYVARGLIDAGFPTVLLEPGDEGARNARTLRRIPDVICATLQDAAFKPGTVPAVGMFDVLEHIEDDAGFVAALHRMLAPAGLVYVTVPAYQWLWSMTDVDADHFRRYSCRQLASRFAAAGFDVLYATYIFEALLPPFYVMRTLPSQLRLRRRRDLGRYGAEHAAGGEGWVARVLESLLSREIGAIANRRSLFTGTSCLLVARKAPRAATRGTT